MNKEGKIRRLKKKANAHLRRYRNAHRQLLKPNANETNLWKRIHAEADDFNATMEKLQALDPECPPALRLDRDQKKITDDPILIDQRIEKVKEQDNGN